MKYLAMLTSAPIRKDQGSMNQLASGPAPHGFLECFLRFQSSTYFLPHLILQFDEQLSSFELQNGLFFGHTSNRVTEIFVS